MAIVAEISPAFILAQQILLCSGDGSPGSPLYMEQMQCCYMLTAHTECCT